MECERVFSKLKLIKIRLRARMTKENLESSMLMSVQHEYMNLITSDEIIDKLAAISNLMKRLLLSQIDACLLHINMLLDYVLFRLVFFLTLLLQLYELHSGPLKSGFSRPIKILTTPLLQTDWD